tara:strand:+ start:1397 stop:1993 length:597 start_codon:yes stop_codon:yes gene_type:complete
LDHFSKFWGLFTYFGVLLGLEDHVVTMSSGLSQEIAELDVGPADPSCTSQEVDTYLEEETKKAEKKKATKEEANEVKPEETEDKKPVTGAQITRACKHADKCTRTDLLPSGKHRGFCLDINNKRIKDDVEMASDDDEKPAPVEGSNASASKNPSKKRMSSSEEYAAELTAINKRKEIAKEMLREANNDETRLKKRFKR